MQLSLTRRSSNGLTMNAQYTLGYSKGTLADRTRRSRRTTMPRARRLRLRQRYYNFDVRHTFNLSAIYTIPAGPAS